ncbi:hypothetical protein BRD07_02140 [Halobacteriales archaeon QS_9_68_42]|nr:MAG: hypothetical protein BRD07_02140 [Halobacteriales archaeon QS_9_68_42]
MLVRPDGATVELSGDWRTTGVGADETPPEPIREFVEMESTPGEPSGALLGALDWGTQAGDRRYHQRVLRLGEEAYVHGTATRVGAEQFGGDDFEVVAETDDGRPDSDSSSSPTAPSRSFWPAVTGFSTLESGPPSRSPAPDWPSRRSSDRTHALFKCRAESIG